MFYIGAQLTTVGVQSWLPTMLEKAGRDPTWAVLAITSFNAGGLLACVAVGWLIDRMGAIRVTLAMQVAASAMFVIGGGLLGKADQLTLQLGMFVLGTFSQGAYGAINVVVTQHYPVALRAAGLGWAKGISRLGAIIGPILLGYALAGGLAPGDVFRTFSIPCLIGAAALATLGLLNSRGRG